MRKFTPRDADPAKALAEFAEFPTVLNYLTAISNDESEHFILDDHPTRFTQVRLLSYSDPITEHFAVAIHNFEKPIYGVLLIYQDESRVEVKACPGSQDILLHVRGLGGVQEVRALCDQYTYRDYIPVDGRHLTIAKYFNYLFAYAYGGNWDSICTAKKVTRKRKSSSKDRSNRVKQN